MSSLTRPRRGRIEALMKGLAECYVSGDFSDCTLICGPYRFNCHKIILAGHSEHFEAAFRKDNFMEGKSGTIELEENWEDALSHVDATDSPPARPKSFFVEHAKVFATAVKYQVDGLRQLAVLKFKHETMEREAWKEDEFAQAISIICTSTSEDITELRDVAVDLLYTHFGELKDKDSIEEVM